MNTPKFTPGPWQSDRMHLGSSKDRRTGFVVNGPDMAPLPVRICDMRCSPESPFTETQANAQLIAAAPEMFAALQRAEAAMAELLSAAVMAPHSVRQSTAFNRGESATDSALAEVRSVIAKVQANIP